MSIVIDLVIGCRPNFVKAAAIVHAVEKYPDVKINLVHTGQHVDDLSDPFFRDLELPIPPPNRRLICQDFRSTTARLSRMMEWLGDVFTEDKPDYVMVVGDTDSTLAGALAAKKVGIPLIHVEAGLRCGNWKMQEEINRVLVDSISDVLYTTTERARDRLISEGHGPLSVKFVGNVMVDTLYRFLPLARQKYPRPVYLQDPYAVVTIHRSETVDRDEVLFPLIGAIKEIASEMDVIFPVHPRLRNRLGDRDVDEPFHPLSRQLIYGEPLDYLRFIAVLSDADFVMTDSGGVQEETTALGVPCFTLRNETERPETQSMGTNLVVGTDPKNILWSVKNFPLRMKGKPPLWDGNAADRILEDIVRRSCA